MYNYYIKFNISYFKLYKNIFFYLKYINNNIKKNNISN